MSQRSTLSDAERDDLKRWTDDLGPCPKCKNQDWIILERIWSIEPWSDGDEPNDRFPTTTAAAVGCEQWPVVLAVDLVNLDHEPGEEVARP